MPSVSRPEMPTSASPGPRPAPLWITAALIGLYLLLEVPLLTTAYPIGVDEPWYSQVAHSLASGHGFANPVVGSGGGEIFFLYTTFLGLAYRLFGTSLEVGRSVAVAFGVLTVAGVAAIMRRLRLDWRDAVLCTLVVIVSNLSYLVFRVVRPEAAAIAFVVWSVYFLLDALATRSPRSSAAAGLLVGAGFLCHGNVALLMVGMAIAVFAASARHRRWASLLAFLAGSGVCVLALPVFLQFALKSGLIGGIQSILHRTAAGEGRGHAGGLVAAIQEASHFFLRLNVGGRRSLIVAVQMVVIGWGLVRLRDFERGFALAGLVVLYLLLAFVLLRPFPLRGFSLIEWMTWATAAALIADRVGRAPGWRLVFLRAAVALALLNNLAGDLVVIHRDRANTSYSAIARQIDETVPAGASVMTHMLLWFPLSDRTVYTSYSRWQRLGESGADALLASGRIDYVVLMDERGLAARMAGATGMEFDEENPVMRYTRRVTQFAEAHGTLVSSIPTRGYGEIRIWRLTPPA